LVHQHAPELKYSFPSEITVPEWSETVEIMLTKRQRIDFIMTDPLLAASSVDATIYTHSLMDTLSDHYPVSATFSVSGN